MANTVFNIAVISFPRTTSRSLGKYYSKLYNKPFAEGSLHDPEYVGNDCFNPNLIFEKTHILHGHWHSLYKLERPALDYLRKHYKIVTSYRKENLVKASILRITGKDAAFDNYIQLTISARKQWNIWKHYIIEGDNIKTVENMPTGYC
tara:strand:+ start:224 stop:667 length:444 start_codon:yes stop_codon:yes gene_type:complete